MPTPPTPDAAIMRTLAAYAKHKNNVHTARELGIDEATVRRHLKLASERGKLLDHEPAMPGFRISQVTDTPNGKFVQQKPERGEEFKLPPGQRVKGVSALVSEDGREIVKWIKTREDAIDPVAVAEKLKEVWDRFVPLAPVSVPPPVTESSLLTLVPCNDWHIGMFAWRRETKRNWDLKTAEREITSAVVDVVNRAPASETCVILGGGDLLHADNKHNRTDRSGNSLDVDGRYLKVLETAQRMKVHTIDAAAARHGKVVVRILPGNHDEHSAGNIAHFLRAWYRNDSRIEVDCDPGLYWWYRFGKVMLGATHGHTTKINELPGLMASLRPKDWGATAHRYAHGFHVHHRSKGLGDTKMGCFYETHAAPIPPDAYHFGAGYVSEQLLQAITYHGERGEHGRVTHTVREEG